MNNKGIRRASINFFIVAALLVLFGVSAVNNGRPNAHLQIALAVLMGAAAAFLRTGTAEARAVGMIAAATTVAAGAYSVVQENTYIAGTIFAIVALLQLWRAGTAVQQPTVPPLATTPPMAPFDAPDLYTARVVPALSPTIPDQPPPYQPPVARPDDPA